MNTNRKIGEKGELIAQTYLSALGLEILEINWRTGHKEIDVICKENDIYIFIEVKTRTTLKQGMPEESISTGKIKSVTDASQVYLYDKKYKDIRFDVISIVLKNEEDYELLHIRDAFY